MVGDAVTAKRVTARTVTATMVTATMVTALPVLIRPDYGVRENQKVEPP